LDVTRTLAFVVREQGGRDAAVLAMTSYSFGSGGKKKKKIFQGVCRCFASELGVFFKTMFSFSFFKSFFVMMAAWQWPTSRRLGESDAPDSDGPWQSWWMDGGRWPFFCV
jgi:hypothetical protein